MEGEKGEHKNEGIERGKSNKLCSRDRGRTVTDGTESTYGGNSQKGDRVVSWLIQFREGG